MSEHTSEAQQRPGMSGGGQEGAPTRHGETGQGNAGFAPAGGAPWPQQAADGGMGMHAAHQPDWGAPAPGYDPYAPQGYAYGPQAQGGYGPQPGPQQPQWGPGMVPPPPGFYPGAMPPHGFAPQPAPHPEWGGYGAAPGAHHPGAGAYQGPGAGAQNGAGHGHGVAELVEELASGGNGLNSLSKLVDFNDTDFWKGALLGAAAVLVLSNGSVQRTLFGAAGKGQGETGEQGG